MTHYPLTCISFITVSFGDFFYQTSSLEDCLLNVFIQAVFRHMHHPLFLHTVSHLAGAVNAFLYGMGLLPLTSV